jgi:hypothetical protein
MTMIIVRRNRRDLFERFQRAFGPRASVTVLWDRRRWERRLVPQAAPAERRRRDDRRRPPPPSWRAWDFLVEEAGHEDARAAPAGFPLNVRDPDGATLCPGCARPIEPADPVLRLGDWMVHVGCGR